MKTKRPRIYDTFIAAVAQDLGLSDYKIYWRKQLRENIAGVANMFGDIMICKGMSIDFTMEVIAHEMRHVW